MVFGNYLRDIDTKIHRGNLKGAVLSSMNLFGERLLDIGCGKMPYRDAICANSQVKQYVGLDLESAKYLKGEERPDQVWDGKRIPFDNGSFDSVMCTEVLEHCLHPEEILTEAHRVLKPGGLIFFTVPFLWPLHETPNDYFRYTPFALAALLEETGYESIEIRALGGWHCSLAQMLGLWINRSALGKWKRRFIGVFTLPVISLLLKMDSPPQNFSERTMVSGLYGTAIRSKQVGKK